MDTRVKPAHDDFGRVMYAAATRAVVMPRESGASSTPRPLDPVADVSGILDRPVKPGDDIEFVSAPLSRLQSPHDHSPTSVRFDEHSMWVELSDGRTLGVPLAWFPRLLRATPAEREQVELNRVGLHWEAIDEDISIAGLLAGRGDVTRSTEHAA
jgi:hypothetical protein